MAMVAGGVVVAFAGGFVFMSFCVVAFCAIAPAAASVNAMAAIEVLNIASLLRDEHGPEQTRR